VNLLWEGIGEEMQRDAETVLRVLQDGKLWRMLDLRKETGLKRTRSQQALRELMAHGYATLVSRGLGRGKGFSRGYTASEKALSANGVGQPSGLRLLAKEHPLLGQFGLMTTIRDLEVVYLWGSLGRMREHFRNLLESVEMETPIYIRFEGQGWGDEYLTYVGPLDRDVFRRAYLRRRLDLVKKLDWDRSDAFSTKAGGTGRLLALYGPPEGMTVGY
jgi:hypothetical protein